MTPAPTVLLVAPTPRVAAAIHHYLLNAGLQVRFVTSFKAARNGLNSAPALLISEVRLGEYNGLHLALRAQAQGVPSIVVGEYDRVTERDAESLGAYYLSGTCDPVRLEAAMKAAGVPVLKRRRTRAA